MSNTQTDTQTNILQLNPPLPSAQRLRLALGRANTYKEGDDAVGLASNNDLQRAEARRLLLDMTLGQVDSHMIWDDQVAQFIQDAVDAKIYKEIESWKLLKLKEYLLGASEEQIKYVMPGLSSDVIACLAKVCNNKELIAVSSKVFNNRPGSTLGARGRLSSRIQPNSPTDCPLEVLFSVLEGLSYGTGDAIFGINPVSSDTASVTALENVLRDVIETFGLEKVTRYCVLAHVDEQLRVEDLHPGLIDVAFQSIAGNESTNTVFGVAMHRLVQHMKRVRGMYFETGQGSAVTNNAAHGVDMVTLESRAHGIARAMQMQVGHEFMIVNTVAGFIGPEVFKTKEQLIRACLEDIFMGKLHGLIFGVDICSTFHMGIDLDDILEVQREVLEAHPAFLMAVAGQSDPMLSYITTSFRDHPRLRLQSGRRVTDELSDFLIKVGIMNTDGTLTDKAGDTEYMYLQYRRRKRDKRTDDEIKKEARMHLTEFQKRGLDLGYGHVDYLPPPDVDARARTIYNFSKHVIMQNLSQSFLNKRRMAGDLILRTMSKDREDYVSHPTSGESLDASSLIQLAQYAKKMSQSQSDRILVQVVISDGLNPRSVDDPRHFEPWLDHLRHLLNDDRFLLADDAIVIENGRVRAGYQVGREMFPVCNTRGATLHIVGERPGNGQNTFSIYIAAADVSRWEISPGEEGSVDHGSVSLVSGISCSAMSPQAAAEQCYVYLKKRFDMQ
jgi:ethanolamine ammonia-lyase large subunit